MKNFLRCEVFVATFYLIGKVELKPLMYSSSIVGMVVDLIKINV